MPHRPTRIIISLVQWMVSVFHVQDDSVLYPFYYEQVHITPTFQNHFFNGLPVWVIGSVLTFVFGRPGTPYWNPNVWLILWACWTGVYFFALMIQWSKVVLIGVYPDRLVIWTTGISVSYSRNDIIRYEIGDTLADGLFRYGTVFRRAFVVHRHYAKGVRFYLRQGEETAAFVESRHPKELAAALEIMLHPDTTSQ